eukprot:scaffold9267_cov112-Isochrysis_galbana.AAC.4
MRAWVGESHSAPRAAIAARRGAAPPVSALGGPFECNELLQGRFKPPKRNAVDSRSCGSKGGGCNTQKSLCSTLFPCHLPRRAASSGHLAIGPGKCQQCQPVRNARPGSATGARAGAQSHLHRALFGSGRADSFRARFLVHVHVDLSTSIGGRRQSAEWAVGAPSFEQPRARNFSDAHDARVAATAAPPGPLPKLLRRGRLLFALALPPGRPFSLLAIRRTFPEQTTNKPHVNDDRPPGR